MKKLVLLALLAYPVIGQVGTQVGSFYVDGGATVDLSTATVTRPLSKGTLLPATCAVSDMFFKTDATAGENIYLCTAVNTWTQVTGGGGGGAPPFSTILTGTNTTAIMTCGSGCTVNGNINALTTYMLSNAQTGTTYTVLTSDLSRFITFSNASSQAVTLPQAGSVGFGGGYWTIAKNIGVGTVTITPTTSTISGAASITLETGEFAIIRSDGTNYEAATNRIVQGTNITLTKARTGTTVASSGSGIQSCATVSFSATPTFNAAAANCFVITITGNVTSCTISGASSGQILTVNIIEDGTGGRTFACANLNGLQSIDTGISVRNSQTFIYDGSAVQALGFMISTGANVTNQVVIPGATSGSMTLKAPATGGGTVTGFAGTGTLAQKLFTGTLTLATGAISSQTCATEVTVAATGAATTDAVVASLNGDPSAVTGYAPLTTGGLYIYAYPKANAIGARACNPTAGSITPGSAIVLNVGIFR